MHVLLAIAILLVINTFHCLLYSAAEMRLNVNCTDENHC